MLVPSAIFEGYVDWKERSGKSGIPAAREAYENVPLPPRSTAPYQSRGCTAGCTPEGRPRTRERKGDDKSGRTRRIEKVAPVGPGNGIPVLDSARNPRHYRVTKRRSAGRIVRAITTGDIERDGGGFIGH